MLKPDWQKYKHIQLRTSQSDVPTLWMKITCSGQAKSETAGNKTAGAATENVIHRGKSFD